MRTIVNEFPLYQESACDELASTRLSDEVFSVSTSNSTSPEASTGSLDSDKSTTQLSSDLRDDSPDDAYWGTPEAEEDKIRLLDEINNSVKGAWADRHDTTRYAQVIVLLISWEEHDLGQELHDAIRQYTSTFEYLYNYEVWHFEIPSRKPHLALTSQLLELAERDSSETLFVIWYDGHGLEHQDRRGSPRWCSHGDPKISQIVDSSIISATLSDCEADILLVNNACSSLTCNRFNGKGIVESISASAFDTVTYGSVTPNDLSPSMTWAVLQILRDRRCVEEGITVAELHRRICLAVQWGNYEQPEIDETVVSDQEKSSLDTLTSKAHLQWKYPNIRTQPVYTRLSAQPAGAHGKTRSIVLGRLEYPKGCSDSMGKPDMQVQLRVSYPDRIDPKEWIDWLLSAPSCVEFLRLDINDEESWQNVNEETWEDKADQAD
ncbi:hypothetical protein FHL15_004613 [Xylaria flabelliformis]|uniref:Uncharacterized protein n=1 Tax=Xylaria flabelliformis TaxID=2512241 RepID=A0A553I2M4_9PEZI|nr:hypothetical protein FHL15_004613 [Xylaria flabelliformis]